MCPEVDSASENEYQGFLLGVKVAGAFGWRPTTLVVPKVEKIRGLNLPRTPRTTSARRGIPLLFNMHFFLVPVAAPLLRLWVRIPSGAWMSVMSVVCCQVEVSATRWSLVQKRSYRLWYVVVCDPETSWMRRPWPTEDYRAKKKSMHFLQCCLWNAIWLL